jgi:hypothetical protein
VVESSERKRERTSKDYQIKNRGLPTTHYEEIVFKKMKFRTLLQTKNNVEYHSLRKKE